MLLKNWLNFKMPLNDVIMNASVTNGSDDLTDFMIGVSIYCDLNHIKNLHDAKRNIINSKLYNLSFSTNTDLKRRGRWGRNEKEIRRETIIKTLANNNFTKTSNGGKFFEDLLFSKYSFSPEGNGLDCHRHYEALVFKSIPIVEDNPHIMKKYEGLPVLYTHDYSEINDEYLNQKYEEMLNLEYDFSKLFMSSYSYETQKVIKENGNFWFNKVKSTIYWPLDLSKISGCETIYSDVCFLTITNYGYKEITKNCLESLNRLNFKHNIRVICLDKKCYEYFEKTHSVSLIDTDIQEISNFKDNMWNTVTMKKIDAVREHMQSSKYILHTDGDIVYEDPFFLVDAYLRMESNKTLDVISQVNHPRNHICSGYYIIRCTAKTKKLYDKDTLIKSDAYSDNDEEYMCKLAEDKKINVEFFDREFYPNGNILFYRGLKVKPYMMHFNYISGYQSKIQRMKSENKWYI